MRTKLRILIILLLMGLLVGCNATKIKVLKLSISKSSIPEGIAVHPTTQEIFISSVHEDNITKSSANGSSYETILGASDNGYSIGVGLDIWQDQLYALSKFKRRHYSILTVKSLSSESISTFLFNETDSTFFNDLAIDNRGNAYISDTDHHKIYYFNKSTGSIEVFLAKNEDIKYPNGITISSDQSKLFVDSYTTGIRIIDIKTKKILNKHHAPTSEKGIDGLKYVKGKLFFILNGLKDRKKHGLYKLTLTKNEDGFEDIEPVMVNHANMELPTTFSVANGYVYVLANSQLDKLNQENNQIIKDSLLNQTYILKQKIK